MSNASMRNDLRSLMLHIDRQLSVITQKAADMGIAPYQLQTPHGEYMMAPLLVAKANVLLALTNLEKK